MRYNWRLLTAIVVLGTSGCVATGIQLPAVTDAPTGRHDTGRMIWRDLISDTPEQSRRFYEALFGWEFEAVGNRFGLGSEDAYSLIRHNGRLIGGMVNQASLGGARGDISQWVALMSVADVAAAALQFAADGGEILTPPTDVAERGRMAVVVDRQGALLALVETRDGDPPPREPGHGDFLWDELWTSDVAASTRFYRQLAGLDERNVPAGDGSYRLLAGDGRPAFGILAHPFAGERPVWVTYIRVEDPDAITARVEALGGRVYVEPQDRPLGGRVALIADPSGAGIALQTWSFEQQAD